MNKDFINGFVKRAQENGISKEEATKLANFAFSELSRQSPIKDNSFGYQAPELAYTTAMDNISKLTNPTKDLASKVNARLYNTGLASDSMTGPSPAINSQWHSEAPYGLNMSNLDRGMTNKLNR